MARAWADPYMSRSQKWKLSIAFALPKKSFAHRNGEGQYESRMSEVWTWQGGHRAKSSLFCTLVEEENAGRLPFKCSDSQLV